METTHAGSRHRVAAAVLAAAAALTMHAVVSMGVPEAEAAQPPTDPPSTGASESPSSNDPAPGSTLDPPEASPFDEPVGGVELGVVDVPEAGPDDPELPAIEARAWLVADLESGAVLAALNAHQPRPPASTIKLLTAVAAAPVVDADSTYVAADADASVEGSRVGLAPGQTYSYDDIMNGLMLASGNDAAHALGEMAGGQSDIVELMNAEAARVGAFDTHAVTPHGLDDPAQVSSAYDLALIGRTFLADDRLANLAATQSYDFPGLEGQTFQIQNQNRLLGSYDGTIGLKTGYTTNAGHTLVAAAERDDRRFIAVVLGTDGRAEPAAEALLDWAFATDPDAEPLGRLVTPDDVAAAADDAEDDGGNITNPLKDYENALEEPGATSGNVPDVVWASLGVAFLTGSIGLAFRRRRSRSRAGGRYAASRRAS